MSKMTNMWTSNRGAIRRFTLLLALALMLGYAIAAHAAPGDPDPGFDGDGKVTTDFPEAFNDSGLDVAVQEDGKAVVAGVVFSSGTGLDFAVTRLDADGSLDDSFGSGGRVITPVGPDFSNDEAYGVAVRPDGKIVAAGFTNNSGTNIDFAAVRYNPDGSLDTSFGTGGRVITPVTGTAADYAVDVAAQGRKTVLIGRTAKPSHNDFAAVRLNDDGSLDTSFDSDGKATLDFSSGSDDFGEDVAVEPGGKLVVAGLTGTTGSPTTNNFALARYNPDGSLNTSFGHDGRIMADFFGFSDEARSVAIGDDGRIVAAGIASSPETGQQFATARFFGGSDTAPPKVGSPKESLVANSALGAADAVPTRVSWSATDTAGEVTGYEFQGSTDGGPYEDVNLADATATSRTIGLEPGHDYRFRVRATDDNGNRSVWKYGPRFALDAPQENDPSVAYARTWKAQTLAGASGGQVRYATARGAGATLTFTGTEVAWVAPKSKTRGKAAVYLDGAKVATVDLFSKQTLDRQVVFSKGNLDPATPHTLEVRSLGTPGRSRVDVDAFVVLR